MLKSGGVWLPVALFLSVSPSAGREQGMRFALGYFLGQYVLGIALNLANDLTDRAEDLAAGKSRWILSLRPSLAPWVVALTVGSGTAVLALFGAPPAALIVYLAGLALGLAYSIRPVRFKERGLLGLTEYGLCACVVHAAVPAAWVGAQWCFVALFGIAAFLHSWVRLHFHQVVDYRNDLASGTQTYAVRVGLDRARRVLRLAAHMGAGSTLAVTAYLACVLPPVEKAIAVLGVSVAVPAGVFGWFARRRRAPARDLPRELPPYCLGLIYGFWWALPPLLLIRLAVENPSLAVPALFSTLTTISGTIHFSRYRYE